MDVVSDVDASVCDTIDVAWNSTVGAFARNATDATTPGVLANDGAIAVAAVCIILSCTLLLIGKRALFLFCSLVSLGGGAFAVFSLSSRIGSLNCGSRLIISSVAGLSAGCIASCIIRKAVFLIGAATSGAVAYFVLETFPDLGNNGTILFGFSYIQWGIILGSGLVGGIALHFSGSIGFQIVTSSLGAFGVAVGVRLLLPDVDGWVPLCVGGVSALIGFGFQTMTKKRKKRLAEKRKETKTSERA